MLCLTKADSMGEEKGGDLQSNLLTFYFRCFAHRRLQKLWELAPATWGRAGSPPQGSSVRPTTWAPLLRGHWAGEFLLGSIPGAWLGFMYTTKKLTKN